MEVVITGSSGFVGQNLQSYLRENRVLVKNLSLRNHSWRNQLKLDASAIIHLAGKAHDTDNTSNPEEYFKVNRDLTIELFELFLRSDIRDFFYFSSVKAVADTADNVLDENAETRPFTPYGKSKLEAEQYLFSKPLPAGKRIFIIRPCMIHGPGNKGNLNLLYNIVKKGIPWPLAAFSNQRSFLSIGNLNFLIYRMLICNKMSSGIYNFADDDPLSTNELVYLMSQTLKIRPKLWRLPIVLIRNLARIGDWLSLPLNSERLKKLTESYVVSNRKIKRNLGIDNLPLTSKKGLEDTIRSFRD